MPRNAPSWWATRGLPACLWLLPAALFSAVSSLRRALWRSGILRAQRVAVPVIVVGNVAVGGSGKTPVVIWLAETLRQRGWNVGIISRGYGGRAYQPTAVSTDSDPHDVGDEPVLMVRRTGAPLWVGRDRAAAARALLAAHPQVNVIVSDDGLQHYRLARDVEIVVLDERVLGNRWRLPAGPLRESLHRVRDARLAILHGPCSDVVRQEIGAVPTATMRLVPGGLYRLQDPSQRRDATAFAGLRLKAVAGIGRPQRFFESLAGLGLVVHDTRAFPDHHAFAADDLELDGAQALLMTEKDAIKCRSIAPPETWVLPVDAHIDARALDIVLEGLRGSEAA